MKKLIAASLFLFIGFSGFSQGVDLGVKVGANFANIADASGLKNKSGLQAGIFGGVKFSNAVGIQADLLYSQQGAKGKKGGEYDLKYINVPVVLKYYLFRGLNLQAGPQFGFVVDDKISRVVGDIGSRAKAENFDFSGIVGAGIDFPLGLRLDARYNFGFSKVSKDPNVKGKNSVVSVALGYSFL